MKTYKNVNSFLKSIKNIGFKQEISMMRGFDNLPSDVQNMIYSLIADIQNDISEIEETLNEYNKNNKKHIITCPICGDKCSDGRIYMLHHTIGCDAAKRY